MIEYIEFYNVLTQQMTDGFWVEEGEGQFKTIDPICYEWLLAINKLDYLPLINKKSFDMSFHPYRKKELPVEWSFIKGENWLFNFPIEESEIKYMQGISLFFEWFVYDKDVEQEQRIKDATYAVRSVLPEELIKKVTNFIIRYEQPDMLKKQ